MKTFLVSFLLAGTILIVSCKKETHKKDVWYSYQELNCNLNPFEVTADSLQNFKNLTLFLQANDIEVLTGYSHTNGKGWALLVCNVPRPNGFTHYVLIPINQASKAQALKLKPVE